MFKKAKTQWELTAAALAPAAVVRLQAFKELKPMYEGAGEAFLADANIGLGCEAAKVDRCSPVN